MQEWSGYSDALQAAGVVCGGNQLRKTATATAVRDRDRRPLVTDGPFAETREQLGGYYLLDVGNLDQAIEWAHKCPAAKYGTVELRPIQEFDQG